MMLCIDCGNTRLKWGLQDNSAWVARGTLLHSEIGQLGSLLLAYPPASHAVGCNVAGALVAERIAATISCPLLWIKACAEQCGIKNTYEQAEQLGADRWAALIAARALHNGSCLVINAGTATTIDILDADGIFQGGLILPGLALMRAALSGNTAQLPFADATHSPLPRHTAAAIASGAIEATLGAIERMFQRLPGSHENARCIVSGGAASILLPHLPLPFDYVETLVLEGVALIAASMHLASKPRSL